MSSKRTYATIAALAEQGGRVLLIVGEDFEPAIDWDLSGIETYQVPSLTKKIISPLRDLKTVRRIHDILRQQRPQIVHTHLAKGGVLGRVAAYLAGVPHIVHTVHGPTFPPIFPISLRTLLWLLEKICARFTHHFIFVGEDLRQEYLKAGICLESQTTVIRTGRPWHEFAAADAIDPMQLVDIRRSVTKSKKAFLIACVGRLAPMKKLELAIQAIPLLRQNGVNAHVIFAGAPDPPQDTRYRDSLISLVANLNLQPYVHFVGYRQDILSFMKAMDVLLLTSAYEGLPNVIVEAAIVGKPMVTFEVLGSREVIVEGETGYVLPQGDLQGVVEKLTALANAPEASHTMGQSASHNIRQYYNLEKMISEKLLLYTDISENNGIFLKSVNG